MAAEHPEKVKELHKLMFDEFKKYQVFPLDASVATRMVIPRPSVSGGRNVYTFSGVPITGMPRGTGQTCSTRPTPSRRTLLCRKAAPKA